MYNAKAYAANSESSPLGSTTIARRDPNEHDVQIEILFCGICHSDLHAARNEWSEFSATVYCPNNILTYNSPDEQLGGVTYGGYSESIVVDEHFVLRVPSNLSLPGAAPLLCAGITTYSPLRHWGAGSGKRVGVVGLGGLGHVGVKLAHALGAHVVAFTTSPGKTEDALRLGADEVVVSRNANEMEKHAGSFDFILDTVSAAHDINA